VVVRTSAVRGEAGGQDGSRAGESVVLTV
jgi:hypothetical protein